MHLPGTRAKRVLIAIALGSLVFCLGSPNGPFSNSARVNAGFLESDFPGDAEVLARPGQRAHRVLAAGRVVGAAGTVVGA